MSEKKVVHSLFLSLFFFSEALVIVILCAAFLKVFSQTEVRILYGIEATLALFLIIMILAIKVRWKIRYLSSKQENDPLPRKDVDIFYFFEIPLGIVWIVLLAVAHNVNGQAIHSAILHFLAHLAFFWDCNFVRPRL